MKKTITAREMRFIAKDAIDTAIAELVNKYGSEVFQTKTLQHILETEAVAATNEIITLGRIRSLREREGWDQTAEVEA